MRFYVYAIIDQRDIAIYVGKGSGHRCRRSAKKAGGRFEILERFKSEKDAYLAERRYIKELQPELNKCRGGNGARAIPIRFRRTKEMIEMDRIGSQRYAARFLLTKLDERNCEQYGISKIGIDRLRQVAYGQTS